jgi:hypothetical protein
MQPKSPKRIAKDFHWEKICAAANADDYGVIVTWTSRINGENQERPVPGSGAYKINPLNWQLDETPGSKSDNIKAVFYMPEHKNIFWRKVEVNNFCGAVLNPESGLLEIECPTLLLHMEDGKYTNNCISIFAGNIAANAVQRVQNLIKYREWKSVQ